MTLSYDRSENRCYTLEGSPPTPTPCPDLTQWWAWWEHADRTVAITQVTERVFVSTVFLGQDRQYEPDKPPLLFETIILGLGDRADAPCWRYTTWSEAVAGHAVAVLYAQHALKVPQEPTP